MNANTNRTARAAVLALATLATGAAAQEERVGLRNVESFRPVATFNVPSGSTEICDVGNEGRLVVYTDFARQSVGFVDITDPSRPRFVTTLPMGGEPTSVSVVGNHALVAVWADLPSAGSPPPAFLPGELVVVDISNPQAPTIVGRKGIGFHPDSIKARRIGNAVYTVVAIENQPVVVSNGLVTSEDRPGSPNDIGPAGLVQVVRVDLSNPANSVVTDIPLPASLLQAEGLLYPNDPQPEFVAWNGNIATVTLQENNGVAVVDMSNPDSPVLSRVFSTLVCAPRAADLRRDAKIDFSQSYPTDAPVVRDAGSNPVTTGARMPDAIAIHPDGSTVYTADEGELSFTGGRGFSIWTPDGDFVRDDGGSLEQVAVGIAQYPDARSAARGIEVEGIASARFGTRDFLFALSERGSFMAVYDVAVATEPRLIQVLPTGISPEGILPVPERGLVICACEGSGTLSIFEGSRGRWIPPSTAPTLFTKDTTPWSALSGLCRGDIPGQFFSVGDNAMPTKVVSVQTGWGFAPVRTVLPVLKNGVQATYDCEGIARDTSIAAPASPGFWLAVEGNGTTQPNLLVQVDGAGAVVREIQLPNSVDAGSDPTIGGTAVSSATGGRIRSNGFEGMSVSTDGRYLFAAVQRSFTGEFPTGTTYARVARYDLQQVTGQTAPQNGLRTGGNWDFFYYAFDTNDPDNWPGLSEITTIGTDQFLVIERDKGIGSGSTLKKVYAFSLRGLTPDADGMPGNGDTVTKVLVADCVEEFSPFEKIEGIGISHFGDLWVNLDNDGGIVEPRMRNLGRFRNPLR